MRAAALTVHDGVADNHRLDSCGTPVGFNSYLHIVGGDGRTAG